MKITIYTIKGGTGKTSIALNLALTLDGFGIVTNEPLSPIDQVLGRDRILKLEKNQPIPDFEPDMNLIFDFGGYLDGRVVEALSQSDLLIVPTINEQLDVQAAIDTLGMTEAYYCKSVMVVVNRSEKSDIDDCILAITKYRDRPNLQFVEIKKTRAMPNLMHGKKSIAAMVSEGGLKAYHYRPVAEQFRAIIDTIIEIQEKKRW